MSNGLLARIRRRWVWRLTARRDFYKMAAGFIADGKPVYDTLQVLEERWRKRKDGRADDVALMIAAMRGKGHHNRALRFAEAVSLIAPPIEAMAIDAGEQSGDIAGGLRIAASISETQERIASTIRAELAYPFFLGLMLLGLLVMLKTTVIPVFDEISPRHVWPSTARVLGWLADHAVLIAGIITTWVASIFIVFALTKGQWVGDLRNLVDDFVPPWNIYRKSAAAVMMASFAAFIRAGMPFSAIIDKMSRTASPWERRHLEVMRARMRRGLPDAEAMATELFDEDTCWEISIYGKMSDFASALEALSNRLISSTIEFIRKSMGVLRFMAMAVIAGSIVWIYGAFFAIVMSARNAGGM